MVGNRMASEKRLDIVFFSFNMDVILSIKWVTTTKALRKNIVVRDRCSRRGSGIVQEGNDKSKFLKAGNVISFCSSEFILIANFRLSSKPRPLRPPVIRSNRNVRCDFSAHVRVIGVFLFFTIDTLCIGYIRVRYVNV